ncbi:MAG TPA: ubiquinol-cytochrome c reductase iron-sulfur subunit [Stellaceae bacterium]
MADLAQHNVSGAHAGETRRDFLILTATAIGAVGVAATIWPFIDSLNPARDTLALSTTEVDLAPVQVGQRLTVAWRGKPVFIDHRTPEEIKAAQDVNVADLRDPQPDSARVTPPCSSICERRVDTEAGLSAGLSASMRAAAVCS